MELIGRDRELAVMARALEEVRGGCARVLGVLGEAGIGKSALLAEIGEHAERAELLVLAGRCAEHERKVPFGVAIDALDGHVAALHPSRVATLGADLGAVLPAAAMDTNARIQIGAGAAERFHYHRALRELLELLGRERPVALVLDDLHWADEASIELVLHLLRRPPAVPHLLVLALRPVGPAPRLLDAARGAPGFALLALEPLGHDASLGLLASVPDRAVRERVAREAGGNPLFLRELARVADRGDGALPSTVLAAVGLEVAALEPRARALIEGAAVAGDPFDPELAAAAAGLDPDAGALDGLVAVDLVRATGSGRAFEFRHPLVRRAVYDAAPPAWRLDAHERVASALQRRGAGPAVRAHHVERFARAGDRAAIALITQAADAAADSSPATAAHWYAAALRLLPDSDAERRVTLLAPMALALAGAGRLERSRAALVEVLERLEPEPTARRLELVTACARVETQMALHGAARRRLLAAFQTAPREHRAGLAFELAAAAMALGRPEEVREWAARAAVGADPALLAGAEALGALGEFWSVNADTAAAALDRATARLSGLDDDALAGRLVVLLHVARAQQRLGRFADAVATSARGLAISRQTRQGELLVWLLVVHALALRLLLDLDAALTEIEAAEESARLQAVPHLLQLTLWARSLIHHERGETADADRAAQESAELLRTLEPSEWTRIAACALAPTRAERDPERCIRAMVGAAGPRLELVDPSWSSSLLLVLVRAGIATGRLTDADRWATEAAARTAQLQLPATAIRADCARAEVLLAHGHPTLAAELAQNAATAAERIPAPLDAADARLLAGRSLAAAGDTEQAKAALQQVAADAGRGGALRLRDSAARELRRLGTRLSAESRRAARHDRLTEREHDVATLVAQGQTNKQVAAALHVSVGTVENILTRTYAKLGVRSRTQLARKLTHS